LREAGMVRAHWDMNAMLKLSDRHRPGKAFPTPCQKVPLHVLNVVIAALGYDAALI
jgi:hypothetical protein